MGIERRQFHFKTVTKDTQLHCQNSNQHKGKRPEKEQRQRQLHITHIQQSALKYHI